MTNLNFFAAAEKADFPEIKLNPKLRDPKLYEAPRGLEAAVNVAIALGQPLLLTGEPGTGKTELAHHLADFFGLGEALVFNAQTNSLARDLFYRYDALRHFQFSQTQKEPLSKAKVEADFIDFEALGKAITSGQRRVVLIDEIDKAPRDFPNDALAAIDDLAFKIAETGSVFKCLPDRRPLILMTSNSEKNLPDAFLRRVVYFHIPFPDVPSLAKIVGRKVENLSDEAIDSLVAHFWMIRKDKKLRKNPATAELLQWAGLLKRMDFPAEKLADGPENLSADEKFQLLALYSVLAKSREDLEALAKLKW